MFNNAKLQARISELEWKLNYEQGCVERYKRWYEELRNKEAHKEEMKRAQLEARSAPVIIDWDNVDVFSVERMHTRNNLECMPYTVIGYWKNVNENGIMVKKTGEWIYQVNDVGHHKIAEEFKEYIDKKGKKK